MATIISTKTTSGGGLAVTGDASGILQLASADGTTAVTIDASQNVGMGNTPTTNLDVGNFGVAGTKTIRVQSAGSASLSLKEVADTYGFEIVNLTAGGGLSISRFNGGAAIEVLNISRGTGAVLVTSPAGLGYGTGSGGTVTQATSKSTAVTLNKPTGQITMNAAALAAGASVVFAVGNTTVGSSDVVVVNGFSGGVDPVNYRVEAPSVVASNFYIRVTNISAGSLSQALVINFAIIKGATA